MIPHPPSFTSVLCPIDFSDCSKHALAAAAWLASMSGKPLYLLHAIHLDMPHYLSEETKTKVLEHWKSARGDVAEHLKEWCHANCGNPPEGLQVHYEVSDAPPVEAIIASAHRHSSIIVMGTHGRTGWRRVWMGSVTSRTIEQVRVPVLVIPPVEEKENYA
jgi:universal stress protein A